MDRNKKPAAGGNRRAGREFDSRRHSTASLVLSLRACPWRADEALALARRRINAELRRRHLRAAAANWRRDMAACRYHAERLTALKAVRHG